MELNRLEIFKEELTFIKNPKIKDFTIRALYLLPTYFFEIPASSTAKYHPQHSLGVGGLVRHVKSAVVIAIDLFRNETIQQFTDDEKDIIVSALILHDGIKLGFPETRFTVHEHPMLVAEAIRNHKVIMSFLEKDVAEIILHAIESHMGQWNSNKKSDIILPTPKTEIEKFVHLCDYISSRRYLVMDFDKCYE